MEEVFKDIPGYEGYYQVSNLGNVKSLDRHVSHKTYGSMIVRERILKNLKDIHGYYHVFLRKNLSSKIYRVHKLVAMSFLEHKPDGYKIVVDHINFDRLDNRLENLRLITNRENTNQKHLKSSSKYVGVYWYKKSKKWVSKIRIDGKRKYLGCYKTEIEASNAYQDALKHLR